MIQTEPTQGKLFPVIPSAFLAEILEEALNLARRHPEILSLIEADQDRLALEKKQLRLEEKTWQLRQTPAFEGFEDVDTAPVVAESLGTGRKRMSAETALVFLLVSEHVQSVYSQSAVDRLMDSRTVAAYLESRGLTMPGLRTIGDNVNAISIETRGHILKCQLADIRSEGLDNFLELHGDSTHVEANSAFPTDSSLIHKLLARVWNDSQKLPRFGLNPFRRHWTERWLEKLRELDFAINVAKRNRRRRKLYRKYLNVAVNLLCHLADEAEKLHRAMAGIKLPPIMEVRLHRLKDNILQDLVDCCHIYERCRMRNCEGQTRLGGARVLSIADSSAAWIQKGGREAIVGFRPQVARSRNGFVTALIVPEGNKADSAMAVDLVDSAAAHTGVMPAAVSFDDGYPSASNWKKLQEREVDLISFSGSKGKKLLGEQLWKQGCMRQLRKQRSSVESTMFRLKHNHGFGGVRRRGIEAVREELLAKVILHNFRRMIEIKKRKPEDTRSAAA